MRSLICTVVVIVFKINNAILTEGVEEKILVRFLTNVSKRILSNLRIVPEVRCRLTTLSLTPPPLVSV